MEIKSNSTESFLKLKEILNLKSLFFDTFKNNFLQGLNQFEYLESSSSDDLGIKIFLMIFLFLKNPNKNKSKIENEKSKIIKDLIFQAREIKSKNILI